MPSSGVTRYAQCRLPTEYGAFELVAYREGGLEHVAMTFGNVADQADVLTRIHSECITGEVFHSLRCDCREQLELAFQRIAENGSGIVIYLRQEGRGIGLGDKIRAYELQQRGHDTVDANRMLGFADDLRQYGMVHAMLDDLRVRSIALMTNNPAKVSALTKSGVVVTRRLPHIGTTHDLNRTYLDTKRSRMGHVYGVDHALDHADRDDA